MSNSDLYNIDSVTAGETAVGVPEPAGFVLRFVANIIDGLILGVFYTVIFVGIFFIIIAIGMLGASDNDSATAALTGVICCLECLIGLAAIVIPWLYFAWFESSSYMGTPGKILIGIKVTDEAGGRISFGKATVRLFFKILTNMFLYIGYIAILFTEKKQGLYDMIAGTLVVKSN